MTGRQAGFLLLAALLLPPACRTAPGEMPYRFTRFAMDTVVAYTILAPSPTVALEAMQAAHQEVERVAALLWEEDPASDLYAFNRAQGRLAVSPEVFGFLTRARAYYDRTDGAFDVTIKPVLELYGFETERPAPPHPDTLRARLSAVGMARIDLSTPLVLDKTGNPGAAVAVGGVAKGYAVDRAVQVLRDHGIRDALVNAGGDLYAMGTNNGRPWSVGVQDPDDAGAVIDTLYLSDQAVATSGDYQRYYVHDGVRYHHILDPRDGRPGRYARSATVVAATTEAADAYATALFVAGPSRGLALLATLPGVEGMVVDTAKVLHASPGYGR